MSLQLRGIKTIANKLKQTKREKLRERHSSQTETLKERDLVPESSGKLTQDPPLGSARSSTKVSRTTVAPGGRSRELQASVETKALSTPTRRKKQQRATSDVSAMSRQDSSDLTTPMSVAESTTSAAVFSKESDSVKVFVRIRPPSAKEIKEENQLSVAKTSDAGLQLKTNEGFRNFAFDAVVGDGVDQETLFHTYAASIVERCLSGYNGCIFAYGQTGSGKTYTMLGDVALCEQRQLSQSAGIIPRAFKYLFELLEEKKAEMLSKIEFECKCSFLEIYNEGITDLLNPGKTNLPVREDKNGAHAAGLTETPVHSSKRIEASIQGQNFFVVEEAVAVMRMGMTNRKVAHTQMNAESSRSHSILSCIVTAKRFNDNGGVSVLRSRLNLVDLAGSERQSTTGASGTRLKEAANINKSLTTLGMVIMSLADTKSKKPKHVPYRDSKLTFLLQDSLGGNANAVMIANVSPSTRNINETLSTLRFARGAKRVKNKAVVNQDCVDNVSSLKAEIALLKDELRSLKEKEMLTIESVMTEDSVAEVIQEEPTTVSEDSTSVEELEIGGLDKALASALRREDGAHRTVLALSEEIVLLQTAVEIKESEIRKYKLIGKLKDDKIQRLEDTIKKQNRTAGSDDAEFRRLKNEVEFFKEKASRAPDAIRYAIENMQLKHELSTLKWSLRGGASKDQFEQEITELREKLLEVNEEFAKYRELGFRAFQGSGDECSSDRAVSQTAHLRRFMRNCRTKAERDEILAKYYERLANQTQAQNEEDILRMKPPTFSTRKILNVLQRKAPGHQPVMRKWPCGNDVSAGLSNEVQ